MSEGGDKPVDYSQLREDDLVARLGRRAPDEDATETSLAEEELKARLLRRDIRAFEALYDRYGSLVYSTALRVVVEPSLAEDVAQEVFLRLWRRPENYVPQRGRFLVWLLRVARNRAIDEVRMRGRRLKHEAVPSWSLEEGPALASADDPLRDAQLADERRLVQRALATLPPDQRQAIELAYLRGLTQQEIAKALNQPLGTVKTRIRLGMQKLKALLLGEGRREDSYGM